MIKVKRGLDLPLAGKPEQIVEDARPVRSVALLGSDYPGVRPTMAVQMGDKVKKGELLFNCKKTPGVSYTAPAGGTISDIRRGPRRSLTAVVIDINDPEEAVSFSAHKRSALASLNPDKIRRQLVESGLWTAFRTRPFSKVPAGDSSASSPEAIFINTMDTNPVAVDPAVVLSEYAEDFIAGVELVSKLTAGEVFVCSAGNLELDMGHIERVVQESFSGPHPAGLSGTHIHFLKPVGVNRTVWTINYQDVIAVGKLFLEGQLWTDRIIALGGPPVRRPRLLRTRIGANVEELSAGEIVGSVTRLVSGSVLSGHTARGPTAFLGRYHLQLSVLAEDTKRELLGWMTPGIKKHSAMPIYLSRLLGKKNLPLTTSTNGSPRGMVPVGMYECVMPLDILPTQLLRALLTEDLDLAIQLGCMELEEEDLALCTYVCPGKYEYGPVLRQVLTRIEQEG